MERRVCRKGSGRRWVGPGPCRTCCSKRSIYPWVHHQALKGLRRKDAQPDGARREYTREGELGLGLKSRIALIVKFLINICWHFSLFRIYSRFTRYKILDLLNRKFSRMVQKFFIEYCWFTRCRNSNYTLNLLNRKLSWIFEKFAIDCSRITRSRVF